MTGLESAAEMTRELQNLIQWTMSKQHVMKSLFFHC